MADHTKCGCTTQNVNVPHKMWLYHTNMAVPNKMWLYHTKEHIKTFKMAIIKGIFQDDCLFPFLFCLAWIPLTNILKRQETGYVVKEINKVRHLFYIDYLKLFYRYETEL
jgi:hypothetical protein